MRIVAAMIALGAALGVPPGSPGAETLEPGFAVEAYVQGLNQPTAFAFDPDGRLFVAEKGGVVRIAIRGMLRDKPVLTLPVYDFFECGLGGLALDPNYAEKPYLYLFATMAPDEQQIIRYRIVEGTAVEPKVIRSHLPSGGTIHNGGCLRFGTDGMLYFSIGDNAASANAQSATTLAGKICRITPDGDEPADNPFTTVTGAPSAVFAMGFRNPFRFCFAPDGRLYATDVGSEAAGRREEINLVTSGGNYGWPIVEGAPTTPEQDAYVAPLYAYHDEGSSATGIVYYDGDHFPDEYRGDLFQLDYTLSKVFRVRLNADGSAVTSHTLFVQAEGSIVDIVQGPDGRLYYDEIATGILRRITYPAHGAPEPGGGLDENDWGGDPDEDDAAGNANENDNSSNGNTGGGVLGNGLLNGLCGPIAPAASLMLAGFLIIQRREWRRR